MDKQSDFLKKLLDKEIPVLTAEIRALYGELDRKWGLMGAKLPITFGYEEDLLGAYKESREEGAHFHFSLLFVGYCLPNPLKKEDRLDLYKHEYAHYMAQHMEIPKRYQWQPGIHGSAWKYCCSLIGAAPSPYYKAGEGLMKHDYDKALKDTRTDVSRRIREEHQNELVYRAKRDSRILYKAGDSVVHPKFGEGTVVGVEAREASVLLQIRFGDSMKKIDQKWLVRSGYSDSKR